MLQPREELLKVSVCEQRNSNTYIYCGNDDEYVVAGSTDDVMVRLKALWYNNGYNNMFVV